MATQQAETADDMDPFATPADDDGAAADEDPFGDTSTDNADADNTDAQPPQPAQQEGAAEEAGDPFVDDDPFNF